MILAHDISKCNYFCKNNALNIDVFSTTIKICQMGNKQNGRQRNSVVHKSKKLLQMLHRCFNSFQKVSDPVDGQAFGNFQFIRTVSGDDTFFESQTGYLP